jgi:hypothetical protein
MKVEQTKNDWQERIGTIRQLQDEEGNVTATITSWNLTDNKTYVEVKYRIDPLQEVYTEQFKAPEPTDNNTILERFLDELGYNISTMHLIETEQPTFEVSPTEGGDWSIKDMIETNEGEEQSQEYEPPEWATKGMDTSMGIISILCGGLAGFVAFPLFALNLYRDELACGFTHKSIALLFFSSYISTVALSIILIYLF